MWNTSTIIHCEICNKPFYSKKCLDKHILRDHKDETADMYKYKCECCGIKFTTLFGLSGHISLHKITSKEYYDKYLKKENEDNCVVCGNPTNFNNMRTGYVSHCSPKCTYKDPEVREKVNNILMEKYGTVTPLTSDIVKQKMIEKYGHTHPMKAQENKDKLLNTRIERYGSKSYHNIDKMKSTLLERYGEDNPGKVQEFRERAIQTGINRYGNATNGKKIGEVKQNNYIQKLKDLGYDAFVNGDNYTMTSHECGHTFDISSSLAYARITYGINLCVECNPIDQHESISELEVLQFIKDNYSGEVVNKCKTVIRKELDIYLPELKVAFEYNGIFWHSEKFKDKDYHLNKLNDCKDKGVKLFNIFEQDWKNKKDIIKSMILNILGKSNKIYGRDCIIQEVKDIHIIRDFLDSNHIQGYTNVKIAIGLYYGEELVALMGFSKSKFDRKYEWELTRFCNKINISVTGGASKIFKYFINTYKPKSIISYSDKSWSSGNMYDVLKFTVKNETLPSYFYVDVHAYKKYHKSNFKKSNLKKMGYDVENKTEAKIMSENNNYCKIWDCGKTVHIWVDEQCIKERNT